MRWNLLLLYPLLLTSYFVNAQQFGGTRSSVKWSQINTDTVRIIFPKTLDSVAQRVATVAHELGKNYTGSIGNNIKKINIVLREDVTLSNGYVALGPYRSEYYLTPPQNAFELGAQSWVENLTIHEFRHVQQYSNFNVGGSKVMSILFGENGEALANAAAVPDWFFEGDAVYNETMLSKQGRGRIPQFFNGYKSLYYDNRHYSYMKLRNPSFKHFIPDHYELGYLLVAYGREKYGDEFWRKVTHDASSFEPLFYPMQGAIEKYTDINFNQFVKNAFAFYNSKWKKEETNNAPQWITATQKNNVINYRYPYASENGSLIVLKNTFQNIPAIYTLNPDSTETKIVVRDIGNDDYFSYNNGKIVYASYQPDVRWGNSDYSVIKLLDVTNGKEKRISSHTKYFSPDISHDGKTIAAVEIKRNLQSDIIIMNEKGTILNRFSNSQNFIYSYPKFSGDDRFLYIIVRNNRGEMGIEKRLLKDGTSSIILPVKNRILGFPVVNGDTLLYSCSNNGRDEIWAYIGTEQINYRLASYQTGLYQASFTTNGELVTSVFTSEGYRLAKLNSQWQKVNEKDTLINLYVTKPFNKYDNNVLNNLSLKEYKISKYPRLSHLFNFHSWNPYLDYPNYSFSIYGENVLNTLQSELYYTYNSNEKYNRVGYTAIYGGWYLQPVIDVNETWNRSVVNDSDAIVHWNEFKASGGLRLPLNLSGGKQYRFLSLTTTFNINTIQWTGSAKQLFANRQINYIQNRITYNGQIQKAVQQIYPRWAQSFLLQYRNIINKYSGHQLLVTGSLYLPGLAKTHNLVINSAFQRRDTANEYSFTNDFPFSRGYNGVNFPVMWKLGGNYYLPLMYPDWGFANIVYFNRIHANAFFDYSNVRSLRYGYQLQYKSYGAEIYFDTRWWNQQSVTFGIRYSRLIDYKLQGLQPDQWEIILPVTILR